MKPYVLADVCKKITKQDDYTVEFVDNNYSDEFYKKTYNQGRLAILLYDDCVNYISFSEEEILGRNSSIQSVPTTFAMYYNCKYSKKRLFYYFLSKIGNAETSYHLFSYRLFKTVGFKFLNIDDFIDSQIVPFNSLDDMIYSRNNNKDKNKANNSSYITKSNKLEIDIYGKVYGANKYETSLMAYAASYVANYKQKVTLYEMLEKDLKELPRGNRKIIEELGVIDIIPTDMTLEKKVFEKNNSLRSPRYTYNLFKRFKEKKCAFCDCNIPELIEGAHIWPVSEIKKDKTSNFEEKLKWAIDGDNGLWLCTYHHTLFDENIIRISLDGDILIDSKINSDKMEFIKQMTIKSKLPKNYINEGFKIYLKKRYNIK